MHDADCFAWPDYLDNHRISEASFAKAYAVVSDIERSWIKKNIAQLYAFASPDAQEQTHTTSRWSVGFQSSVHVRPKDWTVLFLAGKSVSPSRSVAALLPAMTSGVENISAILVDSAEPQPRQLVALELCGLDLVYTLDGNKIKNLLAMLAHSGSKGVILDPDHLLLQSCLPENWRGSMALWQPAPLHRLGIWTETPNQWDWSALAWNHPGWTVDVWGKPPKKLPPGFISVRGDKEALFNAGYQVLGIPARFLAKAPPTNCNLILTPGQECCWLWPDLHRELFLSRAVCLATTCDLL
jgi:hypothetical protein